MSSINKMLSEQDVIEYKNAIKKISGIELSFEEARRQAEQFFQAYSVVYSKNLLDSENK